MCDDLERLILPVQRQLAHKSLLAMGRMLSAGVAAFMSVCTPAVNTFQRLVTSSVLLKLLLLKTRRDRHANLLLP